MPAPQNSEAGLLDRHQGLASGRAAEPVFPIAEEREVPVDHPVEQGPGLLGVTFVATHRAVLQLVRDLPRRRLHPVPVGEREPHVVQVALDLLRERAEPRGVDDAVDLDVLEGLQAGRARVLARGTRMQ